MAIQLKVIGLKSILLIFRYSGLPVSTYGFTRPRLKEMENPTKPAFGYVSWLLSTSPSFSFIVSVKYILLFAGLVLWQWDNRMTTRYKHSQRATYSSVATPSLRDKDGLTCL